MESGEKMIDIEERYDMELRIKEYKEEYLQEHSDRDVALERIIKIEMDCIVGDTKEFGRRHITITQPIDVKLNKEFVDLLEKASLGESGEVNDISIKLGLAFYKIGE